MARFVIDASATLPWCLKDEETAWTVDLLRRLTTGDQIVVPAHWPIEVSNALLMATRRKRIPEGRAVLFLDELAMLPINVEPALTFSQARAAYTLCEQHNLTFYDGTYLELARRLSLPIATLDEAILKAAPSEDVPVVAK